MQAQKRRLYIDIQSFDWVKHKPNSMDTHFGFTELKNLSSKVISSWKKNNS